MCIIVGINKVLSQSADMKIFYCWKGHYLISLNFVCMKVFLPHHKYCFDFYLSSIINKITQFLYIRNVADWSSAKKYDKQAKWNVGNQEKCNADGMNQFIVLGVTTIMSFSENLAISFRHYNPNVPLKKRKSLLHNH